MFLFRKGSVQQLIFIVTQVDQTYEQHWKQSKRQDEEPDPISVRIEAERHRIRREIEVTLDELGRDNESSSVPRYREQLAAIEIAFTSATNHRDSRHELVKHPLSPDDPGGMKQVQNTHYEVLSTESRLATAKYNLQVGFEGVYRDFLSVVQDRRSIVRSLKDRDVVETKLANFRERI